MCNILIDLHPIVYGIIGGLFSGLIFPLITYYVVLRADLRNRITKEFKVSIKEDSISREEYRFILESTCSTPEPFELSEIKIKLPNTIDGNSTHKSTYGEQLFAKGWWHLLHTPVVFTHSYTQRFTISANNIITAINNKEITEIQIYAVSSKFGTTKSNILQLKTAVDFEKEAQ